MSVLSPSIESVELTKKFGSFVALDNLNLKVSGPKCVGLLGPNGAGKSTLLKIFSDMIKPTSGKAYINGIDITHDKKRALQSCGVLIESPEIYSALTAREALLMFAELKGIPKHQRLARVPEVAKAVGMEESWLDKTFGTFSRGMKQRVNLAAALVHEPEILLLDEPTTGLDPRGMAEFRDILNAIKKKTGKLIFISSHQLRDVFDICDEVAVIDRGRLLYYGMIENAQAKFNVGSEILRVGFARPIGVEDLKAVLGNSIELLGDEEVSSIERLDELNFQIKITGGGKGLKTKERIAAILSSNPAGLVSFHQVLPLTTSELLEETYLNLVTPEREKNEEAAE